MNEGKSIWDMKAGRGLRTFVVGLAISCTVAAGQQEPSFQRQKG